MKKFILSMLILIFILGFLVRLYRFDNPVADWHAFRQGDTNAVSALYVRDGINLLYPRFFDISNVASGVENPKGYRFVEFPIYNTAQVGVFGVLGFFGVSLVEAGRLVTIIASIVTALFVYLLTKKYAGEIAGFSSAFIYLFVPYSIFYSRVILPDPAAAAAIMGGIYFFDKWVEKSSKLRVQSSKLQFKVQSYLILSIFFTALAFLLKPYTLFFTLPMAYLVWKRWGFEFVKKWQLWLFAILTITPLVVWRLWISQFPEGIPASDWLFNGNGIRFRPAFFRWIFYERLTKLILGYGGVFFVACGLWQLVKNKNAGFFLSFAASSLLYLFVIATGNVQHDYYQIYIIPTVAIFGGLGISKIVDIFRKVNIWIGYIVCATIILVSFYFSWMQVRDYFNINDRGMVAAAQYANMILPQDAIVIAPYDNSSTFLNIIGRQGWYTFSKGIEELISMGAQYLVITNPTQNDFNGFGKQYEPVASSSGYLILKLK